MTKAIKQMEMDVLKNTFKDVRDLVVLSIKGLTCQADYTLRATLRKKNIRLQVVKNTLTRKVFGEMGIGVPADSHYWAGPTAVAWGANSVAELSRAVDAELKNPKTAPQYKDKVVVKGAIAEGQPVPFDLATKLPTRVEAIGGVLAAILGPAGAIAGCLTGPAGQVAGQIQTISEKKEGEGAPAEGAAAPAAAG